ncbi:class I SAM-dependent methyltransferase [Haloarcula marina]|uniref:class I SAM-dependent methyltransferase n=1 Tax=Haloarcula marina TaxID=2961574 RepID=UPI0020B78E35|nr:class I SAM-dependent methyltransferase [Halomicroarcula marina]
MNAPFWHGYPPYRPGVQPVSARAYGFDAAYSGAPAWDIGRPQRAFVALAEAGEIRGRVLDIGCGTGELSLYLADRGHDVLGVDFAPQAVARARQKARWRGSGAQFLVWDALAVDALSMRFDTVVDSALFHCLDDAERDRYVEAVHAALRDGGRCFVLAAAAPERWGRRPGGVAYSEFGARFADGWDLSWVRNAAFENRQYPYQHPAYLAKATRQ